MYVLKVKKMKKLVLMAAAIVAESFASCGNKAANAEQAINKLNGAEYVGRQMVVKEALPRN